MSQARRTGAVLGVLAMLELAQGRLDDAQMQLECRVRPLLRAWTYAFSTTPASAVAERLEVNSHRST